MNPALIFAASKLSKRYIILVLATMAVIVALPFMAVFSLGTSTLTFLFNSDSNDSTSAISTTAQGLYEGPEVAGDTYAWGNCTYWAFALRLKAGDPIPTTWGNANTWAIRAVLDGYEVDHTPAANAIMQTTAGDLGHVAYVTDVDATTGAWTVSEMNVKGLDVIDVATYPASSAQHYSFIHDKAPKNGL
ncbi:MAG TPA: CHAP domain-containing protein [Candidatus Saccharimonadales bacterium]|nr:CHAP domain-containing protein [Candidatus Saccharimonadales bacterium]